MSVLLAGKRGRLSPALISVALTVIWYSLLSLVSEFALAGEIIIIIQSRLRPVRPVLEVGRLDEGEHAGCC